MYALVDQVGRGWMVRVEGTTWCRGTWCRGSWSRGLSHQIPPMNRPGLSTPVGSNCALMLLISCSASLALPQTSVFDLISRGQPKMASEPPRVSNSSRNLWAASRRAAVSVPCSRSSPAPTACATSRQDNCSVSEARLILSKKAPRSAGNKVNLHTREGSLPLQSVERASQTFAGDSIRCLSAAITNI